MAGCAILETQSYALDVDGFRERFGIAMDVMNDDDLLVLLHERRSRSKVIPLNAREESTQWLKEHRKKKKGTV